MIAIAGVGITRPTLYELADGYRGWFLIRYEDPTCPRLQGEACIRLSRSRVMVAAVRPAQCRGAGTINALTMSDLVG